MRPGGRVLHIRHILTVWVSKSCSSQTAAIQQCPIGCQRLQYHQIMPAMDFSVAIGKGKAASIIVITRRHVLSELIQSQDVYKRQGMNVER